MTVEWPFPVGTVSCPTILHHSPRVTCDRDVVPGTGQCGHCAAGYEPTDAELASRGVLTEPTDPGDSPSYTNLTYTKGNTQ